MLLKEAHGNPRIELSKAQFLLTVLKEYDLVDATTVLAHCSPIARPLLDRGSHSSACQG